MLLRVEMVWWWLVVLLALGVLAIDYEEEEEPYIELVEVWGSMVVKAGVPQLSSVLLSNCRTYVVLDYALLAQTQKIPLYIQLLQTYSINVLGNFSKYISFILIY